MQRAYRPGDEDGWVALLLEAGFEEWDRPRIDEYLADPERREGFQRHRRGRRRGGRDLRLSTDPRRR